MMPRHDSSRSTRLLPPCAAPVVLAAVWLAGCTSLARDPNTSLLPPTWMAPTTVAAAPPVVYEQAMHPMSPRQSHPFPAPPGPVVSSAPASVPAPVLPPPAPPADPEPDLETQQLLEDLRIRIDDLEQELRSQEADLQSVRRESAAAREAAESLASEMDAWRRELAQVRVALREQQAADLQMLDQVNETLRQILGAEAGDFDFRPTVPTIPPDVAAQPDLRGGTRQ